MKWRNSAERYGLVGQALHWLVVLGLIAAWLIAEAAEGEDAGNPMGLHRSVGITILGLAILRVLWRLLDRRPSWPAGMAAYERAIARATHVAFYALLFALPLTGWLITSAEGEPVVFFGLVVLPPLSIGADEHALEDLHETLFNVLVVFAVLHTVGALKHHFWDRDRVLRSMLPRGRHAPDATRVRG